MTGAEAAELLVAMRASWSRFARDDATSVVWMPLVIAVDWEVAKQALAQLTATLDDPPSIAQWQEACRSAVRATAPRRVPELSMAKASKEFAAGELAKMRALIAAAPPLELRRKAGGLQ